MLSCHQEYGFFKDTRFFIIVVDSFNYGHYRIVNCQDAKQMQGCLLVFTNSGKKQAVYLSFKCMYPISARVNIELVKATSDFDCSNYSNCYSTHTIQLPTNDLKNLVFSSSKHSVRPGASRERLSFAPLLPACPHASTASVVRSSYFSLSDSGGLL